MIDCKKMMRIVVIDKKATRASSNRSTLTYVRIFVVKQIASFKF